MQNGSAPGRALAPARKAPAASQAALISGSTLAGSKVFSMGMGIPVLDRGSLYRSGAARKSHACGCAGKVVLSGARFNGSAS